MKTYRCAEDKETKTVQDIEDQVCALESCVKALTYSGWDRAEDPLDCEKYLKPSRVCTGRTRCLLLGDKSMGHSLPHDPLTADLQVEYREAALVCEDQGSRQCYLGKQQSYNSRQV